MVKAVIIDDEKKSCQALSNLVTDFCEDVVVSAIAHSVKDGLKTIQRVKPDIVFLDIEMPKQNGFELLDEYDTIPFNVVFTTAYDEYAIKAFRYAAVDYLLKPIMIEELQAAIEKAVNIKSLEKADHQYKLLKENINNPFQSLALPSADGLVFVKVQDIVYCEADSNYTVVYLLHDERIVVSRTLGKFEEILADINFARIHNSYLINLNHIKKYHKQRKPMVTMVNDVRLKLSQTYRSEFMQKVSKL